MEATSLHFLAIFLLLVTNMSAITSAASSSSASSSAKNSNFIKTSCSTTTYPKLCNQYLSSYASVIRSNPWKLCNSALAISLQATRNASSLVAALSKRSSLTKSEASIVKDCIENLSDTVDELKQSIKVMAQMGSSSSRAKKNVEFQLANVRTWVSAAITDENTCTDGLAGRKVSARVKNQIRSSIKNVARITSNALSLINSLKY